DAPDEPGPLAELAHPLEAEVLEQLDRRGEHEPPVCDPAGDLLRNGLDGAAAGLRDEVERAGETCAGNTIPAMVLVRVEARDAPVGRRGRLLLIGPAMLGQDRKLTES